MSLFNELKRRNVFRVGVAYIVVAWLVLQVGDVVINNIEAPGWVFQAIMLVLGIGFPVVLLFAWAFELTPEGIQKEKDVDRSQSITSDTGRKLDRAIIGILTIVVAYLLIDKLILQDRPPAPVETVLTGTTEPEAAEETGPSVAVLPFINMSGDTNNEYFSDGLTETLLHMLAQLPDLRVAARTSSFAFKGQNASIDDIATTLGVAHILEGSVQKAGNRVRVTAQLIRADDGFHIWSQNYDRMLEDIFAIQDEIAADVAGALGTSLLGDAGIALQGVSTQNTSAYDYYLKALEQQAVFSYGSLGAAESMLRNALADDPGFIEAKLALARNHLMKFTTGLISREMAEQAVGPLLQQVRNKRPDDPMARALELSLEIRVLYALPGEQRDAKINEILALLPKIPSDTWVRQITVTSLRIYNALQQALEVTQAGLMLDPLSAELYSELANIYRDMDRYEEAHSALSRALELAPDNPNHYSEFADHARETGDLIGALDWTRQAIEKDAQDHELAAELASTLFLLGLAEEGERWANRCYALAPQSVVCRSLQLSQARARRDRSLRMQLAEAMLRDDVDLRRFGFFNALTTYADLMTENNRAKEAYELLVSLYPSSGDHAQAPDSLKIMLVRHVAVELMAHFAPRDQYLATLNLLQETEQEAKLPWLDSPRSRIENHLLRGEVGPAVTIALEEDLDEVITDSLGTLYRYASPLYRDLAQVPEVAARLRERRTEQDNLTDQVRVAMLAPEWNQ